MSKVFLDMAISLDGFVSGPNGEDGGLHDWYFAPSEPSQAVIDELLQEIGAMVLGRRSYSVGAEHSDSKEEPYQMPHFVLTHRAPDAASIKDTRVRFVTDGIVSALEQAIASAGDKDICIAGGADTARQFLQAGLIDEIRLHLVPVLLGGGLRLFDGQGAERINLERTRVIEAVGVTHLRFDVKRVPA